MNLFPFVLLMLCLPLGTSPQSIAAAVSSFFLVFTQRRQLKSLPGLLTKREKISQAFLLSVIVLPLIATLLNAKNPEFDIYSNFIGYIPLLLVPSLFALCRPLSFEGIKRLDRLWLVMMILWAIVVFSQNLWGWKIQGVELIRGDFFKRSQGFYSHPLTLAYVALMIWPFHLVLLCKEFRNPSRYLQALANLILLYFSASRTAQAVAICATVGFTLYYFKGRVRCILIGGMVAGFIGIFSSKNIISQRFKSMTSQISEEKESPYADDRIAFWIVHWNMVKERPLLGHGINLDRNYRISYYEAIGLHGFKKAYEAHNQLLQLAAEGGIPAALAFLSWLISVHFNWRKSSSTLRSIRDLTLVCLFFGGLTQNAYFDSEVRFALMTLFSMIYAMRLRDDPDNPSNSETLRL